MCTFLYRVFAAVCILLTANALAAQSDALDTYTIGPKDKIQISVAEDTTLNVERRVDEAGTIQLAYAGTIPVAGLTAAEAAEQIASALGDFLLQATVRVEVVEFRSQPITVMGAVREPGTLPFAGQWTLLEALVEVGGLSENRGRYVHVLRRSPNGLTDQIEIDLDQLYIDADPRLNIPVFPNDLITVAPARDIKVTCIGAFNDARQHVFSSSERVTVLSAVGAAGGPTDRAGKMLQIKRRQSDGSFDIVELNYKKLLDGRQEDILLGDGDIIVLKESFF